MNTLRLSILNVSLMRVVFPTPVCLIPFSRRVREFSYEMITFPDVKILNLIGIRQ